MDKSTHIVAWVILLRNNVEYLRFPLQAGLNYFGRDDASCHVHIRIPGDPYISCYHAFISVIDTLYQGRYFELRDNGAMRGGVPSKNGTFIEDSTDRVLSTEVVYLISGTRFRMGQSVMLFFTKENLPP